MDHGGHGNLNAEEDVRDGRWAWPGHVSAKKGLGGKLRKILRGGGNFRLNRWLCRKSTQRSSNKTKKIMSDKDRSTVSDV